MLDSALTTLALCWRVERGDGVAIGFTGHDRDLVIGGMVYRAAPGMVPSSVVRGDGFDVDAMEVAGALSDDAISAEDLRCGRWDKAAVWLFMTDWQAPGVDILPLARGELGSVSETDLGFTAELRGPAAVLERAVVEEVSPACRAELGDRRCRIDLASRSRFAVVVALEDAVVTLDTEEPSANAYGYGRLRWVSGRNSGLSGVVLRSFGDAVELVDPPALPVAVGDRVMLIEGCDKQFGTCRARFGNAINFQGEPHVPGNDLLMRTLHE